MRSIRIDDDFEAWRAAARLLLAAGAEPDGILWCENSDQETPALFAEEPPTPPPASTAAVPSVPAAFLDAARRAAAHRDPRRWALLYRLLWRITRGGERQLLRNATDPEVRLLGQWCKAVGREIHKMHAFVRFRLVPGDEVEGRERYVAWFEPEHRIVRLATPFFCKRFASMDWSILTPLDCAHWDGGRLFFTPGLPDGIEPAEDAWEAMWRTYYRSTFNPARLKLRAMCSEMPQKYWKNLPEAAEIPALVARSGERLHGMLQAETLPAAPLPRAGYLAELHRKNAAETEGGPP